MKEPVLAMMIGTAVAIITVVVLGIPYFFWAFAARINRWFVEHGHSPDIEPSDYPVVYPESKKGGKVKS